MSGFHMKAWLDEHVVPRMSALRIYSCLHRGTPPTDILVWLIAGPVPGQPHRDDFDPKAWPLGVKHLIDEGFRFDYTREAALIKVDDKVITMFGGDGTPLVTSDCVASVRLFQPQEDGVRLLLHVACRYPAGADAVAAIKGLFGLFPNEPMEVIQSFGTRFGQA